MPLADLQLRLATYAPRFPHSNLNTDISFDSYHMGYDRTFSYTRFMEDGQLYFSTAVQAQHDLDWADPTCHDFRCPPEHLAFAKWGSMPSDSEPEPSDSHN